MPGEHSHIVKLLRQVERALADERHQAESALLDRIIQKVVHADNVQDALDRLFGVRGLDRFAVRLMWSLERSRDGMSAQAFQHEVDSLCGLFMQALNGKEGPALDAGRRSQEEQDRFYDVLHEFGRTVQELKRRSGDGKTFRRIDPDAAYLVLSQALLLRSAASSSERGDVVKFAGAFGEFLQYVLDHELLDDIRVLNLLDSANLTLQTVTETPGSEDYDSLHQTIELLLYPHTLLH